MNVLILSGCYYPDLSPRSFRTTELSRELVRQGHKVRVYIPYTQNDYTDEADRYGVDVRHFTKNRLRRLKTMYPFWGKLLHKINKLMELFMEFPDIELSFKVKAALTNEYPTDLLISIATPYPIHWGTASYIYKNPNFCKKWIADCGDPYMGATLDTYKKPFYFKYLEKKFCRTVDFLTVPTSGAIEGYYSEFRNKIRVIPQGFRLDCIRLCLEQSNHAFPTFAYAGAVSLGVRNPSSFIDYLIEKNHHFKFVVYTCQPELLLPYKDRLGDSLEIRDYVEREILLFELSKMDFLLNMDNNTIRQTPSKLIDYAIVGKPVLNINVNKLNIDVIEEFMKGNYSHALQLPDKNEFNIVNVVKKITDLVTVQ